MKRSESRYDYLMQKGSFYVGGFILAAVFAAVLSWSYVSPLLNSRVLVTQKPLRANLDDVVAQKEESFPSLMPVSWEGRVVGVLEGGAAYAIQRPDGDRFYAFFEVSSERILESDIRIHGLWLGTTCAYQNTVFEGRCVPEVSIIEYELIQTPSAQ